MLRPGGHLVVTDIHHEMVALGSVPRVRSAADEPHMIPSYRHRASDYLDAALPLGLVPRRCAEPGRGDGHRDSPMAAEFDPGAWDLWPWSLLGIVPGASGAAFGSAPAAMLWHFQLARQG